MKFTTKLTLEQTPATKPAPALATTATPAGLNAKPPTAKTPAPTGADSTAESPRIVDPGPV